MKVRAATKSDIPRLIELGREMRKEASIHFPEVEGDWSAEVAEKIIDSENSCILVLDPVVGFMLGQVWPYTFSARLRAGSDLFFIHPQHRSYRAASVLFDAFREWAKERGAVTLLVGSVTGKSLGKFYERKGLRWAGDSYQGVL